MEEEVEGEGCSLRLLLIFVFVLFGFEDGVGFWFCEWNGR